MVSDMKREGGALGGAHKDGGKLGNQEGNGPYGK